MINSKDKILITRAIDLAVSTFCNEMNNMQDLNQREEARSIIKSYFDIIDKLKKIKEDES